MNLKKHHKTATQLTCRKPSINGLLPELLQPFNTGTASLFYGARSKEYSFPILFLAVIINPVRSSLYAPN